MQGFAVFVNTLGEFSPHTNNIAPPEAVFRYATDLPVAYDTISATRCRTDKDVVHDDKSTTSLSERCSSYHITSHTW